MCVSVKDNEVDEVLGEAADDEKRHMYREPVQEFTP
jgi:hypothetical protein